MIPGTVDKQVLLDLAEQWRRSVDRIEHVFQDDKCALASVWSGIQSVRACVEELRFVAEMGRLPGPLVTGERKQTLEQEDSSNRFALAKRVAEEQSRRAEEAESELAECTIGAHDATQENPQKPGRYLVESAYMFMGPEPELMIGIAWWDGTKWDDESVVTWAELRRLPK